VVGAESSRERKREKERRREREREREKERKREREKVHEGVRAIKKFDYLATSHVELTVTSLALGDQPIVRPGYRALLQRQLLLLLSVVSGLAQFGRR